LACACAHARRQGIAFRGSKPHPCTSWRAYAPVRARRQPECSTTALVFHHRVSCAQRPTKAPPLTVLSSVEFAQGRAVVFSVPSGAQRRGSPFGIHTREPTKPPSFPCLSACVGRPSSRGSWMLLLRNTSAQSALSLAALSHAHNLLDIWCKT
jgi:hypothetical protein